MVVVIQNCNAVSYYDTAFEARLHINDTRVCYWVIVPHLKYP